jgi:hypothetical protein
LIVYREIVTLPHQLDRDLKDTGIKDFALLKRWADTPSSNPDHATLLESEEWRSRYYLTLARAMAKIRNEAEAEKAWQNLLKTSSDPADKHLAERRLKAG